MNPIPSLDDCNFYTVPTGDGQFIGRVREFPNLRTRRRDRALDALDDVITLTRNRIADLTGIAALVAIQQRNHP
ncbi:hypothetical protein [Mycobacterium aquaticum]|uniref:Uncharacterized protein n=1 Tax=Mycobacterium aquaticum TaxID=1927124 RepID=A0A1X0A019_9MYCO|nr:hypothetical protein [Mycobacterium aquaticum]ORA23421.1 hypothetical protein BST13_35305 [Mycobacterium aquaticum]